MKLSSYVALMRTIAVQHPKLVYSETNQSFYRSNRERDSGSFNGAHTTEHIMVCLDPISSYEHGTSLFKNATCEFQVLKRCGDGTNEADNDTGKEECEVIAEEIIGRLYDYHYDLQEPVLHGFDLNSVQCEYIGPIGNHYYGVSMQFTTKANSFDVWDRATRDELFTADLEDRVFDKPFGDEFA